MIKVLTIFGTRPEAIKLAPIIKELEKQSDKFVSRVCITGQHREMVDPFLKLFNIKPDWNLNIMKPNQTLLDITLSILSNINIVLEQEKPDIVLVQGDTTTAFVAALAAFYLKIKIGHVEAGLRTKNKYNPFPEEINRRLISHIADLHFAPTERAKANLLAEGINENAIFVVGNTVVDSLFMILKLTETHNPSVYIRLDPKKKLILVTAHRRESFGEDLRNICLALRRIVALKKDVEIVYPAHLNPKVQEQIKDILVGSERIYIIPPLDYISFIHLMKRAYLILTDSGGIQEEAPSLGKPVLVLRKATERPEAIEVGAAKLVGVDVENIVNQTLLLLEDKEEYERMVNAPNPFGDGHAAERIVRIISSFIT